MWLLLALIAPLVVGGILGSLIRKYCKTTGQKLLATGALIIVVVGAAGLGALLILFSAASKSSEMMEIDDERWFNAEKVVSANFSEAMPLHGACPKPSSPDFDQQVKSKQCSIIFVCGDGNSYLFVGWKIRNRTRQAGTNIAGAVQDISGRVGVLQGADRTFFAHGECFDPVAYFHSSGSDLGGGGHQQGQGMAAHLRLVIEVLHRDDPKPTIPIPEQYWHDTGITPTDAEKTESAKALSLSDSQTPELLVENQNPDLCGSGGCPMNIYGLRNINAGESGVSRQYKPLLESHGGADGFHVLDTMTNGYADLLIDGSDAASVFKFDGAQYKEAECFSHDHNGLDNIQSVKCP
jgi:hypothetical protein